MWGIINSIVEYISPTQIEHINEDNLNNIIEEIIKKLNSLNINNFQKKKIIENLKNSDKRDGIFIKINSIQQTYNDFSLYLDKKIIYTNTEQVSADILVKKKYNNEIIMTIKIE